MSHLGPNGGNLHSCTNNGAVNSGQQDAGLHNTCLHPGPSSHPRHLAARPLFYVHAPTPTPPPFLHYQWSPPMPLFYNPLEGFPGMGYGTYGVPPFPSYMETPAYIIPHTQIQPVDYRRLLQPQAHVSTVSYQNPNQTRRIRPPHSVTTETMNSEVQTEPTQMSGDNYGNRSPLVCSDSGRGTASVSPSSSSSSQKRYSAEANNSEGLSQQGKTLASSDMRDLQVKNTDKNGSVKHGFSVLHPTITKTVQSCVRESLEEQTDHKDCVEQANVLPCTYSHCNVWSVSSSDSIVPVCSSSQQDEVKEGRASSSKIQISLGCGTPQATVLNMAEMLHQNDQLLPSETRTEHEKPLNQSTADADCMLISKDGECLYKIVKLPLDQSKEDAETYQMSSNNFQMRKKCNESVWSIESLPPFIPTKEWLMQNGMFEPEVIELLEEPENCRLSTENTTVNSGKESAETCRISLCDSFEMKSSCSSENEATFLNPPEVEPVLPTSLMVQNAVDVETEERRCNQLSVPVVDVKTTEMSPSKRHLVDCGIQCNNCLCEAMRRSMGPNRRHPVRLSDVKINDGSTEGFYFNGHMQKNQKRPGQWRNRSSENPGSLQALYNGPSGKAGKRGGRNHK